MSTVRVTVVRPKRTGRELVGMLVTALISTAVNAWIVMVLAPIVFADVDLTYWQSFAAMCLVATLLPSNGYLLWSKESK